MIPQAFEYLKPNNLHDAISMLQEHGEDAKILAGGHSLIPMMKLRLATPKYLVDINSITDLEYITETNGFLKIGALTRETALEHSGLVTSKFPIIHEATKMIADPQVRNMATVGGNLAHGDPANDHPAVMLALNATVVINGSGGERTVSIDEFFTGFFSTAVKNDEILTEIRVPMPAERNGNAYLKLERKVGDFATAAVGVNVVLNQDGTCNSVRIGLTNAGITPIRAKKAEQYLAGKHLDQSTLKEAGRLAAEESDPAEDLRGSEEYKRAMFKELTIRALTKASDRAQGGQ
ncbi:MAG: Carbon monoxide dehydrogenase medium chain [Candidatus Heimdallarchaeota archaeon LC_2]|nr:MAG: Carbon monoxide dehydrogenase medium chain [Candidatus Heimdallarchaeota archaeon LC_2]